MAETSGGDVRSSKGAREGVKNKMAATGGVFCQASFRGDSKKFE